MTIPVKLIIAILVVHTAACRNPATKEKTDVDRTPAQNSTAYYTEQHRPSFHFSPDSMWMNDPNGMVFHNNEYHLFYQYYPDSTVWGPMHWGHAISKDLIHWQHMPIALYPDSLGYIFSGSAVIDKNNTSGLGSAENPAMVAIFTYHSAEGEKAGKTDYQNQGIAYSTDNGRTWKKYNDNPVLKNRGIKDFRDPKVFWHEDSKQWVMILAVSDHVELYRSNNLKKWVKLSEFGKTYGAHGGVWECPDLFPLSINGREKWVMLVSINPGGIHGGSATQYFTGHFNGTNFTPDNPANLILWLDYGKDNYAGVTWSNIDASDGRTIFLGWMSNWQYGSKAPTSPWRSAMTIPRELNLKETTEGLRLTSQPVGEISVIRVHSTEIAAQQITGQTNITRPGLPDISSSELNFEFDSTGNTGDFGIELSNTKGQKLMIGFESAEKRFYIDRTQSGDMSFSKDFPGKHTAPRKSTNKMIKFHMLIDAASVELFADDGAVVMTDIFFPDERYSRLSLYSKGGTVRLRSGKITTLNSIWGTNL